MLGWYCLYISEGLELPFPIFHDLFHLLLVNLAERMNSFYGFIVFELLKFV